MRKKKAYFIGIAGKTMGQLAKAFKDLGWDVLGSDHSEIYPPISTYLKENEIPFYEGYSSEHISEDVGLVVASRPALMYNPQNPEYFKAQSLNIPAISYPQALQEYLIKNNSTVIAGTTGKTTITAAVCWILVKAKLDPSYMIGGIPQNLKDGVRITDSGYSVVEGDETPALFENDPPKFMFYKPKYLLLTATRWGHPEVFKTRQEYLAAFIKLVKLLPKDGLLVYNLDSVSQSVIKAAKCRKVSYSLGNKKADYFISSYSDKKSKVSFVINKNLFKSETLLFGKVNLENICGAAALCFEIKIPEKAIEAGIKTFKGVKTRLEFLGDFGGRLLYWDLAQHPQKVKGTLLALGEHFPKNKIYAIFDPSATELKYKQTLSWFKGVFDPVDQVIVRKVAFLKKISKEERVGGADLVKAIGQTQKNVFYQPVDERIINYLKEKTRKDDILVFLSSGGLRFINLIEKVKLTLNEK